MTGWWIRDTRIAGVLGGISWEVRFSTTGRFSIISYLFVNPPSHSVADNIRFDSLNFILEHYVDGDLVDCTTPVNRSKAEPNNLHIWGK